MTDPNAKENTNRAEWEQQPGETDAAYHAFYKYLTLPPDERKQARVVEDLHHRSNSTVERWSSQYRWRERARAYDAYVRSHALEVRTTTVSDAQVAQMQQWSLFATGAQTLAMRALKSMIDAFNAGDGIDTMAFNRLVRTMGDLDTITRRNLGLPTSLKSKVVDEPETDEEVFYIGGSD